MSVQNPKELFVQLLSGLRQGTEKSTKMYLRLPPGVRQTVKR